MPLRTRLKWNLSITGGRFSQPANAPPVSTGAAAAPAAPDYPLHSTSFGCMSDLQTSHCDPREERANRFAAESLIPSRYDLQIRACRSRDEIVRLADRLGIASGIVTGRYQHLTKRWGYFKDLIRIWRWSG